LERRSKANPFMEGTPLVDPSRTDGKEPSTEPTESTERRPRQRSKSIPAMRPLPPCNYDTPVTSASARAGLGLDDNDHTWRMAVCNSVLMRELSPDELAFLKSSLGWRAMVADQTLYKQNAADDQQFYIVKSGLFVASERLPSGVTRVLREYTAGEHFGSLELLYGMDGMRTPRTCTMTCVEAGDLWVVDRRLFDAKLKKPPASPLDTRELETLLAKVSDVPLFRDAQLTPVQLQQLVRATVETEYEPGEALCTKGEGAYSIFAVVEGACVARSELGTEKEHQFELVMSAPTVFGESALSSDEPMRTRAASVVAQEACVEEGRERRGGCKVLVFAVAAIEALVGFVLTKHSLHAFNRKLLGSVKVGATPLFEGLDEEGIRWVLDAITEETVPAGTKLIDEGVIPSDAEGLQIVKRGSCLVTSSERGMIATLTAGDCFGESSLANKKKPRRSTVRCSDAEPALILTLSAAAVRRNTGLDEWREKLVGAMVTSHAPSPVKAENAKCKRAGTRPTLISNSTRPVHGSGKPATPSQRTKSQAGQGSTPRIKSARRPNKPVEVKPAR